MPNQTMMLLLIATCIAIASPSKAQTPDEERRARFDQIDTDQDGKISRGEFKARRDSRFAEFDADDSGTLSKGEFGVAVEGTPAARFPGMAFRRADKNGDKAITEQEWTSLPIAAFDRLDDNEDGMLEFSEFQR